jgi:hypothetical protein
MHLRNNKILKLFTILLFSFELSASTAISAIAKEPLIQSEAKTALSHSQNQNISFLLFLEERSEEEREGKDVFVALNDLFKTFSSTPSALLSSLTLHFSSNKERFDTHPPLFQLHGVFLI